MDVRKIPLICVTSHLECRNCSWWTLGINFTRIGGYFLFVLRQETQPCLGKHCHYSFQDAAMTIWKDTFQNASVSMISSSKPGCDYKGLSAKRFIEIHFVFQTLFKELEKRHRLWFQFTSPPPPRRPLTRLLKPSRLCVSFSRQAFVWQEPAEEGAQRLGDRHAGRVRLPPSPVPEGFHLHWYRGENTGELLSLSLRRNHFWE